MRGSRCPAYVYERSGDAHVFIKINMFVNIINITVIIIITIIVIKPTLSKEPSSIREMEGAPRNPAPRNHFLVWIVKPSGCHCTAGHLTSGVFTEDQQISWSADPP